VISRGPTRAKWQGHFTEDVCSPRETTTLNLNLCGELPEFGLTQRGTRPRQPGKGGKTMIKENPRLRTKIETQRASSLFEAPGDGPKRRKQKVLGNDKLIIPSNWPAR